MNRSVDRRSLRLNLSPVEQESEEDWHTSPGDCDGTRDVGVTLENDTDNPIQRCSFYLKSRLCAGLVAGREGRENLHTVFFHSFKTHGVPKMKKNIVMT